MAKTYFQWAEFHFSKAGIKLHTKFNLSKWIPKLILVSNAKPHDRTKMKDLITENNCLYIFDKGYVNYKKFDSFSKKGIRFINFTMMNVIIAEIISIITALKLYPINLLIFKFCLIHLKNNSIFQRFLYNRTISSLVYSSMLVTKVSILSSESITLITLY